MTDIIIPESPTQSSTDLPGSAPDPETQTMSAEYNREYNERFYGELALSLSEYRQWKAIADDADEKIKGIKRRLLDGVTKLERPISDGISLARLQTRKGSASYDANRLDVLVKVLALSESEAVRSVSTMIDQCRSEGAGSSFIDIRPVKAAAHD